MKIMVTSFKRSHARTATLSAPNPAAGHCWPKPLPETPGHSPAASFGVTAPFSWCTQSSVCALPESVPRVLCKFWKIRGTRDRIANICRIIEKATGFQKNIYFCFIDYAKAFDYVDHNKVWKILKEMRIPDHLTWLLRNLYEGQEATVRTGCGTMDWFQMGKGVRQGCILSTCLFNLHAEYIMQNARLDEAQARNKIAGKNIKNLRYADHTTLWQKAKKN